MTLETKMIKASLATQHVPIETTLKKTISANCKVKKAYK